MTGVDPPAGYVRFADGGAEVVVREALAESVKWALRSAPRGAKTLYGFAASAPAAWPLAGRGTAYAIALPRSNARVVVRHNRHGGAFARLTKDLFFAPTTAPGELSIALELERLGVPTPEVVAYATYRAALGLRRADVLTAEISPSRDLATVLIDGTDDERAAAWAATHVLLRQLAAAGAWHQDLNAKNILLEGGVGRRLEAMVLDVDRVTFLGATAPAVMPRNVRRLTRSVRKAGELYGAKVDERELAALAALPAVDETPSTRA